MTLPFYLLSVLAWLIGGLMFYSAVRATNPGDFFDGNNPSGFHRFVPPMFFLAIAVLATSAAVGAQDMEQRRHTIHCAYPLPGDRDICPKAPQ